LPRVFETILSRPGFENSRRFKNRFSMPARSVPIGFAARAKIFRSSMSEASVEGSDLPRGGRANAPRMASHFVGTPRHSATNKPFERGAWRRCVAPWLTVPPV
jgi:hypothetical protein